MQEYEGASDEEAMLDASTGFSPSDGPAPLRGPCSSLRPRISMILNNSIQYMNLLKTREFWKQYWWKILLYSFLFLLVNFLGVLLVIALVFSTGMTSRWALLLWISISYILGEIICLGIHLAFPWNRTFDRLRPRGKCAAVEFFLFFWIAEIVLLLMLPSAFLFSTATYMEVGTVSTNLRSPRGAEIGQRLNCNYTQLFSRAQSFFGCSVNVSAVDFFYGGAPLTFPGSAAGMTIFRNVFLMGPNYCPSARLLVHELFHVYQYDRGAWTPSVLARNMYLQATLRWEMYEYGGLEGLREAIAQGKAFAEFNMEQQASIAEDHFTSLSYGQNHTEFSFYIDPLLKDCAPF